MGNAEYMGNIGFLTWGVTTYNILTTMSHLMSFVLLLSVMMMMVEASPKPKPEAEPKPFPPIRYPHPPNSGSNRSARSWRRDSVKACRGRNEGAECALCTFRSYQCKGKCQGGRCIRQ